jgi:hypothetical protein
MKDFFRKIRYIIKQGYNPYWYYWFDLLTERKLKYRKGQCIDCYECCKYVDYGHCKYVDILKKRCIIYNNRKCLIWFPVSQKEIKFRQSVQPGFKCKFYFKK